MLVNRGIIARTGCGGTEADEDARKLTAGNRDGPARARGGDPGAGPRLAGPRLGAALPTMRSAAEGGLNPRAPAGRLARRARFPLSRPLLPPFRALPPAGGAGTGTG